MVDFKKEVENRKSFEKLVSDRCIDVGQAYPTPRNFTIFYGLFIAETEKAEDRGYYRCCDEHGILHGEDAKSFVEKMEKNNE